MSTAREIAYLALLKSLREESFIVETLNFWRQSSAPSEIKLAQEIAYGSARMVLALDYIAEQASEKKKLSLKLKEKALLRTAVYQICYMSKMPLYAVVDETVNLAKKHCSLFFAKFLNALLRNIQLKLPQGDDAKSLAIRYSYPQFFVERLVAEYGLPQAEEIFEVGNQPGITMARLRDHSQVELLQITESPFPIYKVVDVQSISSSPSFYIQNATPATLIGDFCKGLKQEPVNVLDLCGSPGGKSIAIHDYFPRAKLHANDISEDKLIRLRENFAKYKIDATLTCAAGEKLTSIEKFDVIVVDAPCSNSGVLNKRPEARWRLSKENMTKTLELQHQILENAKSMLSRSGELWYLTCSILQEENEEVVKSFCNTHGFKVKEMKTILPNKEGWDGGFGAVLLHV